MSCLTLLCFSFFRLCLSPFLLQRVVCVCPCARAYVRLLFVVLPFVWRKSILTFFLSVESFLVSIVPCIRMHLFSSFFLSLAASLSFVDKTTFTPCKKKKAFCLTFELVHTPWVIHTVNTAFLFFTESRFNQFYFDFLHEIFWRQKQSQRQSNISTKRELRSLFLFLFFLPLFTFLHCSCSYFYPFPSALGQHELTHPALPFSLSPLSLTPSLCLLLLTLTLLFFLFSSSLLTPDSTHLFFHTHSCVSHIHTHRSHSHFLAILPFSSLLTPLLLVFFSSSPKFSTFIHYSPS